MTLITRRSLITGLVGLIAAPAIVRASSLMPGRAWRDFEIKAGVDYAFEADIAMSIDGVVLENGKRLLFSGQRSPAVNGLWLVSYCEKPKFIRRLTA